MAADVAAFAALDSIKVLNDSVHGHIELSSLSLRIVDTPQFQRLRDLRAVGGVYEVFPAASHHRFEHCIGVGHLARSFVRQLAAAQPSLGLTEVDMLCVEIAGLCHDLGHGIFSHMFDGVFIPRVTPPSSPARQWEHEHASVSMLRHLIAANDLQGHFTAAGMSQADIHFIQEMILGDASAAPGGWAWRGRGARKAFLFEIVANKRNGIDVDKLDYFARDCRQLNMAIAFDAARLMKFARVVELPLPGGGVTTSIAYAAKEAWNIYSLFASRFSLHKRAYQHRVARCVELMYTDALVESEPHVRVPGAGGVPTRLSDAIFDMEAYTNVSDYLLRVIACSADPSLAAARGIIQRIYKRQLYKFIGETIHVPGGGDGAAQTSPMDDSEAAPAASAAVGLRASSSSSSSSSGGGARVEGYDTSFLTAPRGKRSRGLRALNQDLIQRELHEEYMALRARGFDAASPREEGAAPSAGGTHGDAHAALEAAAAAHCDAPLRSDATGDDGGASPMPPEDLIVEIVTISYGAGDKNPVDKVIFYHRDKLTGAVVLKPIGAEQVSALVPHAFQERYVRAYVRTPRYAAHARLAFEAWCARNRTSAPMPLFTPVRAGTKRRRQDGEDTAVAAAVEAAEAEP